MILTGYELIITIVNKGWSDRVIKVSSAAGAKGATVLHGRGVGSINVPHIFGLTIEPEKEIILAAVPNEISDQVLRAIEQEIDLNAPGTGISMVLPLKAILGVQA